jgi:hypothetical protein
VTREDVVEAINGIQKCFAGRTANGTVLAMILAEVFDLDLQAETLESFSSPAEVLAFILLRD